MNSNVIPFTPRPNTASTDTGTPAPVGRAVYTVKETAHLLSLSLGTTYALIRAGEIPAVKLGGRWAIPRRRFHDWLNQLPDATTDDIARELAQGAPPWTDR